MPSSPEPTPAGGPRPIGATLRGWNRRLHLYAGLYFLFFLWLFALTGLMLNHGEWAAARFWPQRRQATEERVFQPTAPGTNLELARDLLRQLGLAGEIQWLTTPATADRLDFRVSRPGTTLDLQADLRAGRVRMQRTELNGWGVAQTLHTFSGSPAGDPKNRRDWWLTTVWAFAMDAVAAGLAVLVLGGIVMWLTLPGKRIGGLIALASGCAICGWLLFGLRFLGT
jgi:hypothetical protein